MANEVTEVKEIAVVDAVAFDMAQTNPKANFEHAQEIVQFMSEKCRGPQYIANIQGKNFPRVEWWVTVGNGLNLFPREVSSTRFEMEGGGYGYEAVVEVWNTLSDRMVTRASAICTTSERAWGQRDEYAVRSMATTRATGKAYRIGLSSLAVMAGLEPTPADEIPPQGFDNAPAADLGVCPEHNVPWRPASEKQIAAGFPEPWHKDGNGFCKKKVTVPPAESDARREAMEILSALHATLGDQKPYIQDVLAPKQINHWNDINDDDWRKVKAAAEGDLAAMVPEDEQLDFDRE